jgi:hypothetical protein
LGGRSFRFTYGERKQPRRRFIQQRSQQRNGEALDVVTARLIDDPAFRPKSAAATLQIARIAAAAALARHLGT